MKKFSKKSGQKFINCPECNHHSIYTTSDMIHICRYCGHKWNKKDKGGEVKDECIKDDGREEEQAAPGSAEGSQDSTSAA